MDKNETKIIVFAICITSSDFFDISYIEPCKIDVK